LRFWNNDVLTNLDGVAARLLELIAPSTPHPASQPYAAAKPPSPTRGEGGSRALQRSEAKSGGAPTLSRKGRG
jgi:hypothetical protein